MNGVQLAARLVNLPPADVPAVRLLIELQETDDVEVIMARQAEIDEALTQLEEQLRHTEGVVKRCKALRPAPSRRVPAGI